MNAVFDTSTLISAVGWRGKPFQCLELARGGRVEGITCREILEELSEKLEQKLKLKPEDVTLVITDLLGCLRLVSITGTLRAVPDDPDDDKILECAVVADATHVVTGDRRHLLKLGSYGRISIVSAAEFLKIVAAQEPKS